ncbi:hypothetical protein BGZ57DRAFT_337628 [Hyaloscypha finlandica]|nr:hypothetical protein BGZ57DRAFT_337628 [Hyaloscypha finlandica]
MKSGGKQDIGLREHWRILLYILCFLFVCSFGSVAHSCNLRIHSVACVFVCLFVGRGFRNNL